MNIEKSPRLYAMQIMNASTTEQKRKIYLSAPEKFRALIVHQVRDAELKKQKRR